MSGNDLVLKEVQTKFQKQRLIRLIRAGIILAGLVLLWYAFIYLYATARIAQSKNLGVYPAPEEAAKKIFGQNYREAKLVSVTGIHCGPNNETGKPERVWFCTARVEYDRIPKGQRRSVFLAGAFFIKIRDGWVFMSEGAFPGFVVGLMKLFHLEGVQ